MSKKRLLDEVDSDELSLWKAYDRINPLDHSRRAELSSAIIATLIHNSHVAESSTKSVGDFMQDWEKPWREEHQELTPELESSKVDAFFSMVKAQFDREKK